MVADPPPEKRGGVPTLLIKLALSATLVVWLLSEIDLGAARALVAAADPLPLALGVALLALSTAVSGLRWQIIVRALGGRLGITDSLRLSFVGLFFNQFLPSSFGGDAFRAIGLYRVGLSPRLAVTGTLLDRVAALIGIILFVLVFLPVTPDLREGLHRWLVPLLALLLLVGVAGLELFVRLPEGWRRWKPVQALADFAADARHVFLRPAPSAAALACALACQLLMTLSFVAFADALGLAVPVFPFFALVPLIMLASVLPVSIAGWGVREAAAVFGFGLIGVAREPALVMAMSFGLGCLIVSLPGGWLWMALLHRSPPGDTAP